LLESVDDVVHRLGSTISDLCSCVQSSGGEKR